MPSRSGIGESRQGCAVAERSFICAPFGANFQLCSLGHELGRAGELGRSTSIPTITEPYHSRRINDCHHPMDLDRLAVWGRVLRGWMF
jgi:hypothetical protein